MNKQMDIFDFIEKPTEPEKLLPPKSLFEQIFDRIDNPVMRCVNCLCQYCVNNVEEVWHKVRPDEQQIPCFNCDECRIYTGEVRHKEQRREDCSDFVLSDYGARRNRKKIRIVKSGG